MLLRFAFLGYCLLIGGCGSAVVGGRQVTGSASRDEKPRVLSVDYGRARPLGASGADYALKIRAYDPDGQIVSEQYSGSGLPGLVADGGCGLGGSRSGQVETFWVPLSKLRPGTYRFHVTVGDSPCSRNARSESVSRTFTIHAR